MGRKTINRITCGQKYFDTLNYIEEGHKNLICLDTDLCSIVSHKRFCVRGK